ncbi:TPA: DUF550 domain-containing protein [Klebsiella pneumoniae subsp. pneumoniae]|nr:DUF550 domain-containing protein [Klebsiella pneumoniae subsp. pneumoniae]HBQ5737420.1 DUF550 domain-containing protein [Klebsiella pneumoniae subsp. pneumoniae]HBQ5747752.1 DUF550 domain-containing protein [Klebsiella pneumoniae subsp. pneumoniae]HBQ6003160.1 DUF550 domain-containing protein [Klebsiella pneumoniae subsp. pneumoniae]
MLANYPPAQPAKDRDQVRSEHAEWSQATFGNVGPVGPLKHLSKEALEAAAEPGDLSEWADMQFLLWDAQRRAGITDEQITQAMIDKLAVNKQREWPEPKDGEPRLHIKAQPAPVVSAELLHTAASAIEDLLTTKDRTGACVWFDLPFRLRSAANAQPAPVAPEEKSIPNTLSMYAVDAVAAIAEVKGWNACRAAMLQASPVCTCPSGDGSLRWPCPVHAGSSPVIPDGYVLVPMRLTAENGAKGALSGEFSETKFVNCPECFGDDECETCDGSGKIEITVPVTWTTIKAIWVKGVEHFAVTAQEND